ncbi:Uncharacterized protein BANIM336_01185 [Bifidobacterium animalis subsp. animalis IM386]|uniref:Transposase n=1 Tax=Bifidobacterium animalis subsp. animalis IM386 TaxID=1402194 RepID=A0AAV2W3F5_9BIFI|nr:hypothetical protein BANAN_04530 [Bifidobacterium animalis subsp. animalis ATCC 25527]CDI67864.1 Uncharacterized protein BANIM336_01185 [Bifidobacterium animalis subsp. animalis IM386]
MQPYRTGEYGRNAYHTGPDEHIAQNTQKRAGRRRGMPVCNEMLYAMDLRDLLLPGELAQFGIGLRLDHQVVQIRPGHPHNGAFKRRHEQ